MNEPTENHRNSLEELDKRGTFEFEWKNRIEQLQKQSSQSESDKEDDDDDSYSSFVSIADQQQHNKRSSSSFSIDEIDQEELRVAQEIQNDSLNLRTKPRSRSATTVSAPRGLISSLNFFPSPTNTEQRKRVAGSTVRKIKIIDDRMFPECLESKFFSHAGCHLVGNHTIVSFYNNTGTMLFMNFENSLGLTQDTTNIKPFYLENKSPIITWTIQYPWMVSIHENGIIQIYNMANEACKRIPVPGFKPVAPAPTVPQYAQHNAKPHNYCLFINHDSLFVVMSSKILQYDRSEMSKQPKEYFFMDKAADGTESVTQLNDMSQAYTRMMHNSMFLLGCHFDYQFRDISDPSATTAKLLAKSVPRKGQSSLLSTHCSDSVAVVVTREDYAIWKIEKGNVTLLAEIKIDPMLLVTTVFTDSIFILVGHNNGVISVRSSDTGNFLYDLNQPVATVSDQASNLTGYALSDKVNCIEKVGKWVICGLHNGRVNLYDVTENSVQNPVSEYKSSRSATIKALSVENGRIYIIIQKQYEDTTKLALVSWQPHFSVKADAKEFNTLSDFDQNIQVGSLFESASKKPVKTLVCIGDAVLFSLHEGNAIVAFDTQTGKVKYNVPLPFEARGEPVIYFGAVGKQLLAVVQSNCIRFWDVKLQEWFRVSEFWERSVSCFNYGLDRNIFLAGCEDGNCMAWDIKTGQEIFSIFCHPLKINCALPPRDDLIYTGSEDCTIKSFYIGQEGKHGECRKIFRGHTAPVVDLKLLAVSLNNTLFSCSKDGTIRSWDLATGNSLHTFPFNNTVTKLDFSMMLEQKNRVFLIKQGDPKVTESRGSFFGVSLKSGKTLRTFDHKGQVYLLAKATDHDRMIIFSVSSDQAIRKWDARSAVLLATYHTNLKTITAIVIGDQGVYIGDEKGSISEFKFTDNLEAQTKLILSSEPQERASSPTEFFSRFARHGSTRNLRDSLIEETTKNPLYGRKMTAESEDYLNPFGYEDPTAPRSRSNSNASSTVPSRSGSRKNSRADLIGAFFPEGKERRGSQEDIFSKYNVRSRSTSSTSTSSESERSPSPIEYERDLVIVRNPIFGMDLPQIGYNTFSGSSVDSDTKPKIYSSKSLPEGKKKITMEKIRGVFKKP